MKLYATTTSERASKGQGGNQYLQIQLQDEQGVIFGSIHVYPTSDLYTTISIHGEKIEARQKGEKKKGEIGNTCTCGMCEDVPN